MGLHDLPITVAKRIVQRQRAQMRDRHERHRKAIVDELEHVEARMKSDAFTRYEPLEEEYSIRVGEEIVQGAHIGI